jgi:hypothetical protein
MNPSPALQEAWTAAQQGASGWIVLAIAVATALILLEWSFKEPPHRHRWPPRKDQ